jgi:hypothetical protein
MMGPPKGQAGANASGNLSGTKDRAAGFLLESVEHIRVLPPKGQAGK